MTQTISEANQDLFNKIIEEMKSMEVQEVIFNTPAVIKKTPHIHLFTCFGVSCKMDLLAVLDGEGNWHEVLPDQANVGYVLSTVLMRIKNLRHELQYG